MSRSERNGRRKTREQTLKRRVPELGYYMIVTDTNETEQNYLLGLRDTIPKHLQGKLVITVSKGKTSNLVKEALTLASRHVQYSESWIVFDRDRVENFDNIIAEANSKGIKVGWSNPCIEIWFCAYFNVMPALNDSVKCCKRFGELFRQATEQIYQKTDRSIYNKLCRYGNEKAAISAANQKLAQHDKNCVKKPSEMCLDYNTVAC